MRFPKHGDAGLEPAGVVLEPTGAGLEPASVVPKPTGAVLEPTDGVLEPRGVLEFRGVVLKPTGPQAFFWSPQTLL